jgi:hypothetical protein
MMFSPASAAITQVASLPLDPLETRPVKLVLTHDDSSVFPVDDEDYDVFFDDLQIEQAPSLSHLAFGLTDGVHFRASERIFCARPPAGDDLATGASPTLLSAEWSR